MNKSTHKDELNFSINNFKMKELIEIFKYYKKTKNLIIPFKEIIFYAVTLIESIIIISGIIIFAIMLFNFLNLINQPYLYVYFISILTIVLLYTYRVILKKGIINYFDSQLSVQDSENLMIYIKSKNSNNEKNNILKSIKHKSFKEKSISRRRI